jgi:hypothetical protein
MGSLDGVRRDWAERQALIAAARAAVDKLTRSDRKDFWAELSNRVEDEAERAFPIVEPTATEQVLSDVATSESEAQVLPDVATSEAEAVTSTHGSDTATSHETVQSANVLNAFPECPLPEVSALDPSKDLRARRYAYPDHECPEHLNPRSSKKTDRAEAFVYTCQSGAKNAEVGKFIGQSTSVACNTLRYVQRSRGTIRYLPPFWYPALKKDWKPIQVPLRETILNVLSRSEKPLATGAIAHAVKTVRSNASYQSVAAEIMRLRKAKLLVAKAWGGRGMLYALASVGSDENVPIESATPSDEVSARDVLLNGGAQAHDVH